MNFNKLVKDIFKYLKTSYKYKLSKESFNFLCYKSTNLFINFYLEPGSFNIIIEVGKVKDNEIYSLYELLQVVSPEKAHESVMQARNSNVLKKCLEKLSKIIQENCNFILDDNILELNNLSLKLNINRKEYTLKYQFGLIKEKANNAWDKKKYYEAFKLYDSIKENLDNKEKRRYIFLSNKMNI